MSLDFVKRTQYLRVYKIGGWSAQILNIAVNIGRVVVDDETTFWRFSDRRGNSRFFTSQYRLLLKHILNETKSVIKKRVFFNL